METLIRRRSLVMNLLCRTVLTVNSKYNYLRRAVPLICWMLAAMGLGAAPTPAVALEVGAYDYISLGLGWQNLEGQKSVVEGEFYRAELSWGVAKQAEVMARVAVGSLEQSVEPVEIGVGGQFHYPFGLKTDFIWGADLVSRESDWRGSSADPTLDLHAGFRVWPSQRWEAFGRVLLIDAVEAGESALTFGAYYSLQNVWKIGAEVAENNEVESVFFVLRRMFP